MELLKKEVLNKEEIVALLSITDKKEISALFEAAYREKIRHSGKKVFFRGIIEFSNICTKNCFYCGIRRGSKGTPRYSLTLEEIVEAAKFAYEQQYGSVVLQSGEREDEEFVDFVENALIQIKKIGNGSLGITLSAGEQSEETYKRWFDAGAHRYLLRVETTNLKLYRELHPADHSFEKRVECIKILKKLGYQVGTGVMIGLPGQTVEDLADDVLFFKESGVHMIGMGPFIPHHDTPLADSIPGFESRKEEQLELGLKMIAVTRLVLKNANIASTTALHALSETGRELGLLAGANIIMPNITETKYREGYQLYDNKPGINENAKSSIEALESKIKAIGEEVGYSQWGDSPKFKEEHN
ncbi:MAG: [FeFe] hydrogenase H-cluster radical SAM maturase HydE [bacterium]